MRTSAMVARAVRSCHRNAISIVSPPIKPASNPTAISRSVSVSAFAVMKNPNRKKSHTYDDAHTVSLYLLQHEACIGARA